MPLFQQTMKIKKLRKQIREWLNIVYCCIRYANYNTAPGDRDRLLGINLAVCL